MARALAEDLTPLGDLTRRCCRRRVAATADVRRPRPTACWPGACAPPRPSARSTPGSRWRGPPTTATVCRAGTVVGHGRRAAGADPHGRAHGAQLPRPPVGRRHPDRPRSSTRSPRPAATPAGLGHPQDDARAAGAREGGGAGRRRGATTGATCPTGCMLKDNHLARARHHRRRGARPRPLAGPHGPRRVRATSTRCARRSRPGPTPCCSTTWRPTRCGPCRGRGPRAATAAGRCSRSPAASRLETIRRYATTGADLVSIGALTNSAPGPRHRARHADPTDRLRVASPAVMLLAIDVGNTQTVIGLYDLEPDDAHNVGPARPNRPARPLAGRHQRRAHLRRARAGHRRSSSASTASASTTTSPASPCARRCPGSPVRLRRMSERYFGSPPVVIEPGIKTGMPILYDNPKEVGADRIADAVAAFDLYGGPTGRRRLRHRPPPSTPSRPRASTWAAPSSPASRSASTRCSPGPPRCARVELVEPRNVIGRDHGRVDAVGRHLRLHVARRRHGRAHRGRARRKGHGRGHRRSGQA